MDARVRVFWLRDLEVYWLTTYRALNTVGQLVANLQGQIGTLAAQLSTAASTQRPSNLLTPQPTDDCSPDPPHDASVEQTPSSQTRQNCARRRPRPFYGPTSPDYSLNTAQTRIRRAHAQQRVNGHVGIDDDDEGDDSTDDDALESDDDGQTEASCRSTQSLQALLHFRSLLSEEEAFRLLSVYQEVHGDFHPILDLERLIERTGSFYEWFLPAQTRDEVDLIAREDSLLVTNLVLAIALCTESASQANIAKSIFAKCQNIINANLNSPATSVKHVVIALLVV